MRIKSKTGRRAATTKTAVSKNQGNGTGSVGRPARQTQRLGLASQASRAERHHAHRTPATHGRQARPRQRASKDARGQGRTFSFASERWVIVNVSRVGLWRKLVPISKARRAPGRWT